MLEVGNIILVKNYVSEGVDIGQHSFVVISNEAGKVYGLDYDFVALAMSSIKNDEQKAKKLSYPGNFHIDSKDESLNIKAHGIDGYIKADQFYYFDETKTEYVLIGYLNEIALGRLFTFIGELPDKNVKIKQITDNLK